MTTSHCLAFACCHSASRADIKQYIGLPSARAVYQILRSCIVELMRVGIIAPSVDLAPVHCLTPQHVDAGALSSDASSRWALPCNIAGNSQESSHLFDDKRAGGSMTGG